MKDKRHPITGCRVDTLIDDLWLADAKIVQSWVDMAFTFDLKQLVEMRSKSTEEDDEEKDNTGYTVENGIARMHVHGTITKYPTSFSPVMGGTSVVGMRKALDHAAENKSIKAIVIQGESYGGTADGLEGLHRRIKKIDTEIKPIFGFADDVSCSAMYWLLSGTRLIGANSTALVGSVGGMTILQDTSKRFEREGIKVIPITTGSLKATGAPGVELNEEQIKYIEGLVKARTQPFFDSVQAGRKLTNEQLQPIIQTAKTYSGLQAKELGLVDEIADLDDFVNRVRADTVNTSVISIPTTVGARSIEMNLSAEQLANIRTACGDPNITEANALDALLTKNVQLNSTVGTQTQRIQTLTSQIPKQIDADLLNGKAELKKEKLELFKTKGTITQSQFDLMTKMMDDNKQVMVGTALGDGKTVADAFMGVLTLGKSSGIDATKKSETEAQLQGHVATGKEKDDDDTTDKLINQHLEHKVHDYGAQLVQGGSAK